MLDGIIVVNKPKGCTSHDVVSKVKRIFNSKVGHTGTLDPNATGVLPILVGQGTKLSYYLIEHDKEYAVTLQLGMKTDTADGEGNILDEKEVLDGTLQETKIINVLNSFIGKQMQVPPMYSAIKVKGKKLYEYARKNEKVEVKSREIEIYDIKLININKEERQIIFSVKCSKGTYIRSLCENIAESLNTIGYMKELERRVVGNFKIEDSITIQELENNKNNQEFIKKHFITIEDFFKDLDNNDNQLIKNTESEKKIILNKIKMPLFLNGVQLTNSLQDGLYRVYDEKDSFIGIGLVKNSLLKREIIVEKE